MKYPISANIIAQNEATWIEPCILSIVDLVNEVIVINDGSEDATAEIVLNLAQKHSNIKIYNFDKSSEKNHFSYLRNYAKEVSSNNWILRWDADFIAYRNGEQDIENLFKLSIDLNKDVFTSIAPNLHGDQKHYLNNKETWGPEPIIFKKDALEIIADERYADRFDLAANIKQHNFGKHFFLHMNTLKPLSKILFRTRMTEYMLHNPNPKVLNDYWKWLFFTKNNQEGTEEEVKAFKESTMAWKKKQPIDILPFDFDKWGDHPEILAEYKSVIDLFAIQKIEGQFLYDYPDY